MAKQYAAPKYVLDEQKVREAVASCPLPQEKSILDAVVQGIMKLTEITQEKILGCLKQAISCANPAALAQYAVLIFDQLKHVSGWSEPQWKDATA